jgi:hypothetical protein
VKRALLALVVVIVVAAVAAGLWLLRSLDAIVARAIEDTGSALTGTRVGVSSVDVELREGRATVRGLTVANPAGFSDHPALALGEIVVAIDVASVQERSPLVLSEVRVLRPTVSAELAAGGLNLDVLRKNVASAPGDAGAESTPEAPAGEPLRIAVGRFDFEEGRLHADTTAVGGDAHDLALPPVHLSRLGGDAGAPPAEIGERALEAILAKAVQTVAKDRLSSEVEKRLEGAGRALRDLLGVEKK